MSGKATIILTTYGEHWYTDCHKDDAMILEIDPCHKVETTDEGTFVTVQPGTPLYEAIRSAKWSL